MKILFVIRSPQIFHYYESIYNALISHGHNVEILFDKHWGENEHVEDVKIDFSWTVSPAKNFRRRLLLFSREVLSWRRYLLTKNQSSFYADRWLKYVSPKFRFLVKVFPPIKIFVKTNFFGNLLKNFEESTKPDEKIIEDIKKHAPDVVVAGPVCFRQSSADLEYLKAAKTLKVPTVVPVMTWDTLTTKGILHVLPDVLLIWNEAQMKEAKEHHGIEKENIRIVGAPFFDKWFELEEADVSLHSFSPLQRAAPRVSRPFASSHYDVARTMPKGPKNPFRNTSASSLFILYLGSSSNIAPDERWLIEEIRKALDNSENEKIKNIQIIFRPHPANFKVYQNFKISGVEIFPKNGEMPKTKESLQDFYNMLYYSSAVVSINTSGMVDAILAGKPVISLERKEFSKTQSLAQHYKHMRESNALYLTKTSEEFLEIFSKLFSGDDPKKIDREKFVRTFIRPRGLEKSAGEMVVYEIEEL